LVYVVLKLNEAVGYHVLIILVLLVLYRLAHALHFVAVVKFVTAAIFGLFGLLKDGAYVVETIRVRSLLDRQETLHGELELVLVLLGLLLKFAISDHLLDSLLRVDYILWDVSLSLNELPLQLVDHLLFPAISGQHLLE